MKKIIIMLILLLVCFVPALAENTPEVIVDPSVKNVPNYIIDDIITEHPNAGVIHINKVETAMPLDAISTCSGLSVYRYSNIAKIIVCLTVAGEQISSFPLHVARKLNFRQPTLLLYLLPPLAVSPLVTIKVRLFLQRIL